MIDLGRISHGYSVESIESSMMRTARERQDGNNPTEFILTSSRVLCAMLEDEWDDGNQPAIRILLTLVSSSAQCPPILSPVGESARMTC